MKLVCEDCGSIEDVDATSRICFKCWTLDFEPFKPSWRQRIIQKVKIGQKSKVSDMPTRSVRMRSNGR